MAHHFLSFLVYVILFASFCTAVVFPVEQHRVQKQVIKVPSVAGAIAFPLQGDINTYAEYFVNLSIGTPVQTLRVQIDTGSTDLVVFSTGCSKCPKAPNVTYYNLDKSKSGVPIDCEDPDYTCDVNNCWLDDYCPLEIEYGGGGSINGYAITDIIALGNLSARVSLGLIQEISGPFENLGVDGCWGFAYQALSSWGDNPAIDYITEDHKLYDSFSLCLVPDNASMDIGTDYSTDTEIEWTKVVNQEWYVVYMEDFLVGNVSLGLTERVLNSNDVIVDSGTTLYIVSKDIMNGISTAFNAMCAHTPLVGVCNATKGQTLLEGYCFPMTDAQIAEFPAISTVLTGTGQLTVEGENYLFEGTGVQGVFCFGFQEINESGIPVILGDIILQNYHVVFDRKTNKVGWGPLSGCPSA